MLSTGQYAGTFPNPPTSLPNLDVSKLRLYDIVMGPDN